MRALVLGYNFINNFSIIADPINGDRPARGMTPNNRDLLMKVYRNLWDQLCTFDNLEAAYCKAKKGKRRNPDIAEFEDKWRYNICIILRDLRECEYTLKPLKNLF